MTSGFLRFALRRLLAAVSLIVVVSSGALILGHFAPGDATSEMFAEGAGKKAIAQQREHLGLDRPLSAQLGRWFSGLVRFDLGTSARYGIPVAGLVAARAANTSKLAAAALAIAVLVGLPLGVLTGARTRGPLNWIVAPVSVALLSCPPLVAALALVLFADRTGWLSIAPGALAVPALALGLPCAAILERLQSRAVAETLAAPSLIAAAARGVPPARLLWIHAARQSLRPVLGLLGIVIGALFGGSLAVEYVTGWPGLGRLMYDALVSRDLFLVAGCAFFGAIFLAAGNFIADLLRAWADPRVTQ